MNSRFSLGVLLGALSCLGAAGAQAQEPKVVVMDFAGHGGATARAEVLRGLRDEVVFEKREAARKVLSSRRLELSSVAGRAAIAKELDLDYVVWGRVRGRGAAARAEIRIAGPQGRQITERDAGPPGQSKGNAKIQKAARAALSKAIQVAPPDRAEPVVATIIVEEIQVSLADDLPTEKPLAPSEESKPEKKSADPAPEKAKKPSASPEAIGPVFNIMAGAGGRTRQVEINVEDAAGDPGTRTYDSGIFLDIVFRLELRPWARSETKGLRGLALEADGDFGLGLETQVPGSAAKLDTKTWRVLGQLGYLHRLGKHEIGGLLGIGFDALKLETNGNLPSLEYLFLRVGPAYAYFFVERALFLRVDAGFRYAFSYGALEDTFGEATGFGFDAGLSLGGELDVGFSYRVRVSSEFFKPQFGELSGGLPPGLPAAAQGRDGTDLAINFNVMVGWSF
ncbi:MAG TPA: hypothetical protein VFG22_16180 [Polyangiales bacterium]|nr:hypothetical protein [Polyangiales bacterium]